MISTLRPDKIKRAVAYWLAVNRKGKFGRVVDRLTQFLNRSLENDTNDIRVNGERWLLGILADRLNIQTVLDVGANTGQWAAEASNALTGARHPVV